MGKPVATKASHNNILTMTSKRPQKAAKLSPDQSELVDIRSKLNLSQQVFAEKLEISKPRLVSYEQGRTSSVPDNIMEEARVLLKTGGQVKGDRYENMDMPDIITEWAQDLNISYGDDVKLSNYIGASPEAILRWKNLEARPGPMILKQYREMVRDLKDRKKKQSLFATKNTLTVVS